MCASNNFEPVIDNLTLYDVVGLHPEEERTRTSRRCLDTSAIAFLRQNESTCIYVQIFKVKLVTALDTSTRSEAHFTGYAILIYKLFHAS